MMLFGLLLVPSLLAALLAFMVRPYRAFVGQVNALLSLVTLGAALAFAALALAGGDAPTFGPGEIFRADSLAALLMVCVTAVATLTLLLSPGLGGETPYDAVQLRRYHIFINLFIFAMLLAVAANNVGIMWIAVEATTIFSAFIIPLTLTKASVEASWKYILIGSVGIALAFAGTVLGYFDFVTQAAHVENALNWPVLLATAPRLHPEVMRLAFVFILVGYKVVVDATVVGGYTDNLLFALGMLSLLIGCFSLVLARNYKRMLAYSSIEHTGLICLGLALGPLGTFAALLHLINHTAAKSLVFFLVGHIEGKYGSPVIEHVRGLLKVMPWTGGLFAAGLLALIGLPPFGLFITEFALFRAGFALNHPWLMGAALALLAVAFVAVINHLNRMLYGPPPESVTVGEVSGWRIAPLLVSGATLVVLGLTLPAPLAVLLNQIVGIVSRT